jgi:glycosyltransferase involved in cell wall biosynthesis
MDVSIIICTRNRAPHLRETLRSLAATHVPPELAVELIVVDNGSTDETASVVDEWAPQGWPVRYVFEDQPGLSRAGNRGVAASKGRVILFTDDDIRVPKEWIGPMVGPILRGKAEAVAGGIHLADALRRTWMTTAHTMMLADTTVLRESGGMRLIGANMAVSRSVFDVVPGFDPALGSGPESLGFHGETLFSFQLQRAGFRLVMALDVSVEHYPQADRLQYAAFADTMTKQGRSDAYLDYHWRHAAPTRARSLAALAKWTASLGTYRLWPPRRRAATAEGMDPQEMTVRRRIAYHREMLRLHGTPRQYDRLGHRWKGAGSNPFDRSQSKRHSPSSERSLAAS